MPKVTKKSAPKAKTNTVVSRPELPSLMGFTKIVIQTIRKHRTLFGWFLLTMFVVLFLITGLSQQNVYSGLTSSTEEVSGQLSGGPLKLVIEVGALYLSVLSGTLTSALSETQQIYSALVYLIAWLSIVWLLRHVLAGTQVTVRDALYNAGAPILSTMVVGVVAVVQLIPLALVVALVSALATTGVMSGLLVIPAVVLLLAMVAVTLYWLTTTLFAAIVVTIPGTYPRAALRSAKQLITGYRVELIKRLLWLLAVVLVAQVALYIRIILLDALLGYPFALVVAAWIMLVNSVLFVFGSSYLYLLYREIIDERA